MLLALILLPLLPLLPLQQPTDATLPPTGARVKVITVGLGVQVYKCSPQNATYQWTLQMPVATLFNPETHQAVGTHSKGPTWTWNDGSAITGNVIQKQPSHDPANVAWLLVASHSTGAPAGMLSDVTLVRRSDTQAGVPTMGCDAVHQNNLVRVPYKATYTFYTTDKR
ncbi:MAG: DUF3455 domain-containing protein [Acidobacteriaceae bacterium]